MAQHVDRSGRPAALLFVLFTIVHLANANVLTSVSTFETPTVRSITVLTPGEPVKRNGSREEPASSGFLLELFGTGLRDGLPLRWTVKPNNCHPGNSLDQVWAAVAGNRAIYKLRELPSFKVTRIYFCLGILNSFGERWTNLGTNFTVDLPPRSNISLPVASSKYKNKFSATEIIV